MRNFIMLLSSFALVLHVFGQGKKDSCCIEKDDLMGVWQRDSKRVGNGLEQNFRFFNDGTFVVHFSNDNEDSRGIYALKGKYRLVKNQLYLTIISRKVVEGGKIITAQSNETSYIFTIEGGTVKEIKENDPKELPDPIYVILKPDGHILLGNETYYKIRKEDYKLAGIAPDSKE